MSAYKAINSALRAGNPDRLRDELRHWGEQLGPPWLELADLSDELMFRLVRRHLKPTQPAIQAGCATRSVKQYQHRPHTRAAW